MQHFHQPLSGPVSEFLRAIQLVLPNFSFFLSLAFFPTTNFFSRGDDFQKKSCIKKKTIIQKGDSPPTLSRTLYDATRTTTILPLSRVGRSQSRSGTTRGLGTTLCTHYGAVTLLLGSSSSHGRSLLARLVVACCLRPQSICFGISVKRALIESVRLDNSDQTSIWTRN